MTNERVSPAEIQSALKGVEFPATKEDILDAARTNGADENVIRALESISDEQEFSGPQDITKAYGDTQSKQREGEMER